MKDKLSQFFDITFWKFIIVGVINTLVGTGTMFIAYNLLNLSYWVSSASNYVIGSIVSYFLNKHFTFQSKESSAKSVVKFIINITICYLVAYGIARPLVSYAVGDMAVKLKDNLSMLVGMGLFVLLNYCGQRFFVFSKETKEK